MTLPASGAISFSNFNTEVGWASNANQSLDWIRTNTKSGQQSNSLNGYYSKAWYQRNVDGNCNNGNCATANGNCNCSGNVSYNCYNCTAVNCANCDSRAWLQNNCNCACTYNCNSVAWVTNCNCACSDCVF
jgi:hypothetical protein